MPRSVLPNLMVRFFNIHLPIELAYSPPKFFSQGTVGDLSETQADPEKSTIRALSTAKNIAVVAWSFTQMLLKRLPDAVDANPAKVAVGIVKIVLQIKDVRCCSSHRCLTDYGCYY